jgi:hypothetical protein
MEISLKHLHLILEKVVQRDAVAAVSAVEAFGEHLSALVLHYLR